MQPLDLTRNQKAAMTMLVEHRSLVRRVGGHWTPPMSNAPFVGTKTISALLETGLAVSDRDKGGGVVVLAPHLNLDDPAERALAVERHIKGVA